MSAQQLPVCRFYTTSLVGARLTVQWLSKFSVVFASIRYVSFRNSLIVSFGRNGGGSGFQFENCSYSSHDQYFGGISLRKVNFVSVQNCSFQSHKTTWCSVGCILNIQGIRPGPTIQNAFKNIFQLQFYSPKIRIVQSQFLGKMMANTAGGAISCVDIDLHILHSLFRMSKDSDPPDLGVFIHMDKGFFFEAVYTTFDALQIKEPKSLVTVATKQNSFTYEMSKCHCNLQRSSESNS